MGLDAPHTLRFARKGDRVPFAALWAFVKVAAP
jgi:hypothetical protein